MPGSDSTPESESGIGVQNVSYKQPAKSQTNSATGLYTSIDLITYSLKGSPGSHNQRLQLSAVGPLCLSRETSHGLLSFFKFMILSFFRSRYTGLKYQTLILSDKPLTFQSLTKTNSESPGASQ
jgi:hypothetical protein